MTNKEKADLLYLSYLLDVAGLEKDYSVLYESVDKLEELISKIKEEASKG